MVFFYILSLLNFNPCFRFPEPKLNTKKETKQQLFSGRLVLFMVFKYIFSVVGCTIISNMAISFLFTPESIKYINYA